MPSKKPNAESPQGASAQPPTSRQDASPRPHNIPTRTELGARIRKGFASPLAEALIATNFARLEPTMQETSGTNGDRCTCPHPSTCPYCSRMYPCRCEHCPYRACEPPTMQRHGARTQGAPGATAQPPTSERDANRPSRTSRDIRAEIYGQSPYTGPALKHGPDQRGGAGPCKPDCRKCTLEAELERALEVEAAQVDVVTAARELDRPQDPPQPMVPLADVAHVVRNALVPARHHLEKLIASFDDDTRAVRAHRGVKAVLEWVDGLCATAHTRKEDK